MKKRVFRSVQSGLGTGRIVIKEQAIRKDRIISMICTSLLHNFITQGRRPCTPQGDSVPLTPYEKTDNVIVHVKLKSETQKWNS